MSHEMTREHVHDERDEDFNIQSARRKQLISDLSKTEYVGNGPIPSHIWAAVQVCDLDMLEKLTLDEGRLLYLASARITESVNAWALGKKRCRYEDIQYMGPNIPQAAEIRDGGRCVLTGRTITEVAHIYPAFLISKKELNAPVWASRRTMIWESLGLFFPKEKVDAWKAVKALSEDRLENTITFEPTAHRLWEFGSFALKPVSLNEDRTVLRMQFFWQKRRSDVYNNMVDNITLVPETTRGLTEDHWENDLVINNGGGQLKSGDEITMTTQDPDKYPLPDIKILEMQWFFQRIFGTVGAGEEDDEEEDWTTDSDRQSEPVDAFDEVSEHDEGSVIDMSVRD